MMLMHKQSRWRLKAVSGNSCANSLPAVASTYRLFDALAQQERKERLLAIMGERAES